MAVRKYKNQEDLISNKNAKPYPPSWIDSLTAWVGRLPGRGWIYYLGFWLFLMIIQTSLMWIEDNASDSTVLPVHAFLSAVIAFFLALFHYLDERATAALDVLRPTLQVGEGKYQELHYSISTLPRWSTLLAGFFVLSLNLLSEYFTAAYIPEALTALPYSRFLFRLIYLTCWWFFGAFMYHTVHQLSLINHIYNQYTKIDLFWMKPFYAFSNLTALTAGSLTMILYGWLYINPKMQLDDPFVFVWVVIILSTATVTFVLPQLGMHRLQVMEKDRLLDQAYLRLQTVIEELHRCVDNSELEGMEDLNYAISSIEIELNTLKGIPTWPWEPETVQILVTALALPLGLWIIQFILERVLGP